MCLLNFKEFKQIDESNPIIGYRIWRNLKDELILKSDYQNYNWKLIEGPHEVKESNSGIYSNNNYNYYNYYNNNYNYNYYNYYNNYNYYYGIINQWGKVAIHEHGYRSEYAKVITLFTIRESDAKGPKIFLDWIKVFNEKVNIVAKIYKANTIHYQDFNG